MQSPLTALLYAAEDNYLESADLAKFQNTVSQLSASIATHNLIRESEINIFQNIANKLVKEFRQSEESTIESALSNWLSVLRYCTMAMVLDSPEFLNVRLLEWLKDLVRSSEAKAIESRISEMLVEQLSQLLDAEQMSAIAPFLEMASSSLCSDSSLNFN